MSVEKTFQEHLPVIQKLLNEENHEKSSRDARNLKIKQMFKDSFNVAEPENKLEKIMSKKLFQMIFRVSSKIKVPDIAIHAHNTDEAIEHIISMGASTVLKNCGFDNTWRGKGGFLQNGALYGNTFTFHGRNPDPTDDKPMLFSVIPNDKVYVEENALELRGATEGRNCRKLIFIREYEKDEAYRLYPELKEAGVTGALNRYAQSDIDRSEESDRKEESEIVEVGEYFNLNTETWIKLAGSSSHMLDMKEGKEFPYKHKGRAYIPVSKWSFFQGVDSFYDEGLGTLFYDVIRLMERLTNKQIINVEDGLLPVSIWNIDKSNTARFIKQWKKKEKTIAKGKAPILINERSATNPNATDVSAQNIHIQGDVAAWQFLGQILEQEFKRIGIDYDGANITKATATEIINSQEVQDETLKQVMENNVTELRHLVDVTLEFMKSISKNNETPIDITTVEDLEKYGLKGEKITLGMIAEQLKKVSVMSKINSRTGIIPSGVMKRAQIRESLEVTNPQDPLYQKLTRQLVKLNDTDVDTNDEPLQAGMQQAPQIPQQITQ